MTLPLSSVVVTKCGHLFCQDDLQAWLSTKSTCPVCVHPVVEYEPLQALLNRVKIQYPLPAPTQEEDTCAVCLKTIPPLPVKENQTTYLLQANQVVKLSKQFPSDLPRIVLLICMVVSFSCLVVNRTAYENKNWLLFAASIPAAVTLKVVRVFLTLLNHILS